MTLTWGDQLEATPLFLDLTPPASPVVGARTIQRGGVRSDPSIVLLSTPPRPCATANSNSSRRSLRSEPSLEIVDYRPSKERSKKPLRASPSLIIVDGPTPVSSQPPAKKTRPNSWGVLSGTSQLQEIRSAPASSQQVHGPIPVPTQSLTKRGNCDTPLANTAKPPQMQSTPVPSKQPVSSQPPAKRARYDTPSSNSSGPPAIQSTPAPPTPTPAPSQQLSAAKSGFYSQLPLPSSTSPAFSISTKVSPSSSLSKLPSKQTPSTSLSQPTPSSRKSKRKVTDEDEQPKEEKRAARFKPRCPQNILDRVERVRQQRLFMIDRERSGEELGETFSVLGSTGNVYAVVIDKMPRCNCPDALKGNHCKHILFIFLKVLRVPDESSHWYQKALVASELEEIFAQAPLAPNCVAHQHVREAHAQATAPFSGPSSQSVKKRWPTKDDDCPICYETMFGVVENDLKFCDACGNAIHQECWKQWQASNLRSGNVVTCVWCRAENPSGTMGHKFQGRGVLPSEGYLNLSSVAGVSSVRDTSTYYHRWGRGYGGDFFEDD